MTKSSSRKMVEAIGPGAGRWAAGQGTSSGCIAARRGKQGRGDQRLWKWRVPRSRLGESLSVTARAGFLAAGDWQSWSIASGEGEKFLCREMPRKSERTLSGCITEAHARQ